MKVEFSPEQLSAAIRIDAESKDGPVVLEIGFGDNPLYCDGKAAELEGYHYLGIDNNQTKIAQAKEAAAENTNQFASVAIHNLSFEELDLPDSSVDKLYMGNVFAQHADSQRSHTPPREDWLTGFDGKGPFDKLAAQAPKIFQLLKPGGQLIIVETWTPTEAFAINGIFEGSGFKVERFIKEGQPGWAELHHAYSIPKRPYPNQYILIYAKEQAGQATQIPEVDQDREATIRAKLADGKFLEAAVGFAGCNWDEIPPDNPYGGSIAILVGKQVRHSLKGAKEYQSTDPLGQLMEDYEYGISLIRNNHLARAQIINILRSAEPAEREQVFFELLGANLAANR